MGVTWARDKIKQEINFIKINANASLINKLSISDSFITFGVICYPILAIVYADNFETNSTCAVCVYPQPARSAPVS